MTAVNDRPVFAGDPAPAATASFDGPSAAPVPDGPEISGGTGAAGPTAGLLVAIDHIVDRWFDRLRGIPQADAAAGVLSNLSDHGFVWPVVAAVQGRRRGPGRRRAVQALALSGFTSLGVNWAVKSVVRRERPEADATDGAVHVRTPTSSSFPSGHTLASTSAAVVLAENPVQAVAFGTFAVAVAASRVHLKAHHPSDVLGGLVIGGALGVALRPLLRRRS